MALISALDLSVPLYGCCVQSCGFAFKPLSCEKPKTQTFPPDAAAMRSDVLMSLLVVFSADPGTAAAGAVSTDAARSAAGPSVVPGRPSARVPGSGRAAGPAAAATGRCPDPRPVPLTPVCEWWGALGRCGWREADCMNLTNTAELTAASRLGPGGGSGERWVLCSGADCTAPGGGGGRRWTAAPHLQSVSDRHRHRHRHRPHLEHCVMFGVVYRRLGYSPCACV